MSRTPSWSLTGRLGELERLHVGVGGDELDALHAGLDHAVDGVAAAAAYADDLDAGAAHGLVVILNAHFTRRCFVSVFHSGSALLSKGLKTGCKNGAQFGAQDVVFRRPRHARAMGIKKHADGCGEAGVDQFAGHVRQTHRHAGSRRDAQLAPSHPACRASWRRRR